MRATVRLKEGATYTLDGEVFTQTAKTITDAGLINRCKANGLLAVTIHEDAPVPPPAPPKPAPAPKPAAPPAKAPASAPAKPAAAKPAAPAKPAPAKPKAEGSES